MPKLSIMLSALSATLVISGCTSEQIYATGQNMQRSQCMKNPDTREQNRCFKNTETSYDTYQRDVEKATK